MSPPSAITINVSDYSLRPPSCFVIVISHCQRSSLASVISISRWYRRWSSPIFVVTARVRHLVSSLTSATGTDADHLPSSPTCSSATLVQNNNVFIRNAGQNDSVFVSDVGSEQQRVHPQRRSEQLPVFVSNAGSEQQHAFVSDVGSEQQRVHPQRRSEQLPVFVRNAGSEHSTWSPTTPVSDEVP